MLLISAAASQNCVEEERIGIVKGVLKGLLKKVRVDEEIVAILDNFS